MSSIVKKLSVSTLKVENIMTKNVFCLSAATTVKDAIKIYVELAISGAPLILPTTEILLTVVSESDLIKFAAMDGLDKPLNDFIDRLPKLEDMVTARAEDSFGALFKKLLLKPVRRVIVVTPAGHVVGIVSRRDVMKAFVEEDEKA